MNTVCVSWNWLQEAHSAGRRVPSAAHEQVDARADHDIYLGGLGVGMDRATVRSTPRDGAAAVDQGAARHRPAGDRRRRVGEADVGRAEPHRRGPARATLGRLVIPDRTRPGCRDVVAVRGPPCRRDPPPQSRRDPLAGRRAGLRPAQPKFPDRKTGQLVDMLLAYRGARLGEKYINRVLVPLLCGKAGVPRAA